MTTRPLLAAAVTLASCAGLPNRTDDTAGLLEVRERVWRAWFGNDQAALLELLPADFVAIDPSGSIHEGRQHQLDEAAAFAKAGGKLLDVRFPATSVQWLRDAAIVYTTFEVDYEAGGERQSMRGRASEVFERRDGRWIHPGWHMDTVQ
ncbi:MAG: nuclear transport factor 2 family protein [Planctomycetes bacterium]|nr:nuclear transport factor 2 family protein [Planctomycetota bacterium]